MSEWGYPQCPWQPLKSKNVQPNHTDNHKDHHGKEAVAAAAAIVLLAALALLEGCAPARRVSEPLASSELERLVEKLVRMPDILSVKRVTD